MSRQKGSAGIWKFVENIRKKRKVSETAGKSKYEPHQGAREIERRRKKIENDPVQHQLAWQNRDLFGDQHET